MPDPAKSVVPIDLARGTIRDLVDHEQTWEALVAATTAARLTPGGTLQAIRMVASYLDRPSAEVAQIIGFQVLDPLDRLTKEHAVHGEIAALLGATDTATTSTSYPTAPLP